jgi:chaperone modulatory protein CbpM
MITEHDVLLKIEKVTAVQLRVWISEDWIRPAQSGPAVVFNEADLARIRLLDLLNNQLDIDTEAIPIILSLLDQVHDLREQMRIICSAIGAQPDLVRTEILKEIRKE